jgi:tetratricopeptide (TPR) repeat protein
MNIGMKFRLVSLAGVLSAAAAFGQNTPPDGSQPQEMSGIRKDAAGQKIWDSDVERVSEEVRRLNLKLKIKEAEISAIQAYMKGDYASVRAAVPGILKMDPDAIEAYEFLADADAQSGGGERAMREYDQAIERREKWLQAHPGPEEQRDGLKHLAVVFGNRGAARLGKFDFQGALADFDDALKSKTPLRAMIMWEKSEALSSLRRFEEAAALYEQAVELDSRLKPKGLVKFSDPTVRNLCQVFAANGQNVQACN